MAVAVVAVEYSERLVRIISASPAPVALCLPFLLLAFEMGRLAGRWPGAYRFLGLPATDGEGQQNVSRFTTPQFASRRRYEAGYSASALFMRRQGPARKLGGRGRVSVDHPGGDHD
jgi:hypothetical protein